VHPGESVEEKISLSERFGLWISFYPFSQDDYLAAVAGWLEFFGVGAPKSARERDQRCTRRCSSRCTAARAAAASRGSSPRATPARPRSGDARPRRPASRVSAAIVRSPRGRPARDGQVLLAQRPAGKAYAGYWEFPGGKLEPGESPRAALSRELREELGSSSAAPRRGWSSATSIRTPTSSSISFASSRGTAEPVGHDGQAFAWQTPGRFDVAPLLPANTMVLRALELPAVYGITMAGELGEEAFLARARAALDRGLRLVQLREKDWPSARQRALCDALLALAAAQARGCC